MVILGGMRRGGAEGARVLRAVEVVAMLFVANDRIDVAGRLRDELRERGVTDVDEAWVERVAQQIRSGESVAFHQD